MVNGSVVQCYLDYDTWAERTVRHKKMGKLVEAVKVAGVLRIHFGISDILLY